MDEWSYMYVWTKRSNAGCIIVGRRWEGSTQHNLFKLTLGSFERFLFFHRAYIIQCQVCTMYDPPSVLVSTHWVTLYGTENWRRGSYFHTSTNQALSAVPAIIHTVVMKSWELERTHILQSSLRFPPDHRYGRLSPRRTQAAPVAGGSSCVQRIVCFGQPVAAQAQTNFRRREKAEVIQLQKTATNSRGRGPRGSVKDPRTRWEINQGSRVMARPTKPAGAARTRRSIVPKQDLREAINSCLVGSRKGDNY